jgi:hypothetical protein
MCGMLQERVVVGSLKRLVGKCLHVGVLDGDEYTEPEEGTVQGSVLSPVLGNIYLLHVLDGWFERDVAPRIRGRARLIRYADDAVIGLEIRGRRVEVLDALRKRFARFGLRFHPEKPRGAVRASGSGGASRVGRRRTVRSEQLSTSSGSRITGAESERGDGSRGSGREQRARVHYVARQRVGLFGAARRGQEGQIDHLRRLALARHQVIRIQENRSSSKDLDHLARSVVNSSAPPTVHRNQRRLVSRPSTRAGSGATRSAHASQGTSTTSA